MKKFILLFLCFFNLSFAQYTTNERSLFVIRQTNWFTCGPAALATILDQFAGISSTEEEIIKLARPFIEGRINSENDKEVGFSAFSLKKAGEAKGLVTKGFQIDSSQLNQYFDNGGLPVIAHVRKPQAHFVVLIAKVKDYFVIGDPSWGRKILSIADFQNEKKPSGANLLFFPNQIVYSTMRKNQQINIDWAKNKLAKLGVK